MIKTYRAELAKLYAKKDPPLEEGDQLLFMLPAKDLEKLLDVAEAARIASRSIDNFYLKMEQESHKQTIWEYEHDLWFARDEIDDALKELG